MQPLDINRSSLLPLYAQLSEALRAAILRGDYALHDKLPSENELMEQCGLSRMTVRSALADLVNRHYIEKIHGKGAYVIYDIGMGALSGSIDVLLNVSYTYFSSHYIRSISEVLSKRNYRFVIHDTLDDRKEIAAILNDILAHGSAGVLIEPCHRQGELLPEEEEAYRHLSTSGIPYLFMDHSPTGIPGPVLSFNDFGGGQLAGDHFIGLGHRRLAMITDQNYLENESRRKGFSAAAAAAGLQEPLYLPLQDIQEQLPAFLRSRGVTALFCYNDEVALKVMHRLHEAGFRIPEDISLIGFDDTIIPEATNPRLTSIVHPKDSLGRQAAETLLNIVSGNAPAMLSRQLEPQLHVRDSCAVPPVTSDK